MIRRAVLAFGSIPAAATMYFRLHMAETPRYTLHVLKQAAQMQNDMAAMLEAEENISRVDVEQAKEHVATGDEDIGCGQFLAKYGIQLMGCAMTWFLLDVAFYSQGLFQSQVFLQVGFVKPAKRVNGLGEMQDLSKAQSLIALGSIIPGYWATVFTVDLIGRKFIQFMGFIVMTAFMAALAGAYYKLLNPNMKGGTAINKRFYDNRSGWITMYAFCFFFANWGPNSTTFIVPAELFPTKWKVFNPYLEYHLLLNHVNHIFSSHLFA
jgi:MFS transporter, PHS family, inorganic phosphate transporter